MTTTSMRTKALRSRFHSLVIMLVLAVAGTSLRSAAAWCPQASFYQSPAKVKSASFPRIQASLERGPTARRVNREFTLASSSSDEDDSPSATPTPQNADDLTDRFKYKVNALMGAFDPADAESDTENTNGNILNAMLKFPVDYTFTVVGKTTAQDDANNDKDDFVATVQNVVLEGSGVVREELTTKVTPRGSKFTKVAMEVPVENANMIADIYDRLQQLDRVVMNY